MLLNEKLTKLAMIDPIKIFIFASLAAVFAEKVVAKNWKIVPPGIGYIPLWMTVFFFH